MRQILHRLRALLDRPTKTRLVLASGVSLVLALFDMVAILLLLPLVELASGQTSASGILGFLSERLGHPSRDRLTLIVAGLVVGLFVAKNLGAMAFTWWMARFKGENRVRMSTQILEHYLASPYTEVSRRSTPELMRTMVEGVTQVYGSVVYGLMQIVTNGLSMIAILVALLIAAPLPTIVLVAYLGLASWAYLLVMKPKATRAGLAAAEATEASWKAAFAALGALKETRVRGSEAVFVRRFEKAYSRSIRPAQIAEFVGSVPRYFLEILFIIAVGVILVVGTLQGGGGASVIGLLAMFVAAGFRTLPSVTAVIGNLSSLRFGLPYLELVEAEFDRMRVNPHTMPDAAEPLAFTRELALQDVGFSYPEAARAALHSVSLTLPYGSSLALVGGSGAGKTTLVDTLLGLHRPTSGTILADGVDIGANLRGWQANIGYVPQEVFLLDATLAENIAFDTERRDVDESRLAEAIRKAQLDDVVAALPDGVDTEIGERGSRLSGGQRQRVGIARALYRSPRVLVLDEATSALDNETEHRISEAINGLSGDVTVVIVAHRLSTVRHADRIAFMDEGKVVDTGSFEDLRRSSAAFDRLVQLGSLS